MCTPSLRISWYLQKRGMGEGLINASAWLHKGLHWPLRDPLATLAHHLAASKAPARRRSLPQGDTAAEPENDAVEEEQRR